MAARFCQRCGHELEHWDEHGVVRQRCPACGFVAYENSKPCAGVLITRGRSVLLARRGREPYRGMWDIIGGFLEAGEDPTDGARREAQEETGLTVAVGDLLAILPDRYDAYSDWTLNIYYIARVLQGSPHPNDDVDALEWFDADALPDTIAFPGHIPTVLQKWRQWLDAHPHEMGETFA